MTWRWPVWRRRTSSMRRGHWLVGSLVVVLTTATTALAQAPVGPRARQLVVPFENIGREGRLHWMTEASAVVLTDDLDALGATMIGRDARLRALEELRIPANVLLSNATVIRLAQLAGASQVITGGFTLVQNRLTVRVRAIRLDTGRTTQPLVESGTLDDFFAIHARLARRLLTDSAVTFEQMEGRHPPLPALEQYIKGVIAENPATRVSFLREAIRLAPDYHPSRLALWAAYTDQVEHQQALDVVRQVPSAAPESRRARFFAGLSLLSLGRNVDAMTTFADLNREQMDPALFNNLGVAQLRRTATTLAGPPADSYFWRAADLDPDDADIAFNLGYALWVARDLDNAVMWLREAVRRNGTDDAAHYVLGAALVASGSAVEGRREIELAKRLSSTYAEWEASPQSRNGGAPRGLERVKSDLDAWGMDRVQGLLAAAEQRDQRELATFHLEAGRRLYAAGRDTDAIAELRRAVYLSPYDREAHLLLGQASVRVGRVQEAIAEYKVAIWIDDRIDARLALATAYLDADDPAAARVETDAVLSRDPMNVDARRLRDRLDRSSTP